MSDWETNDYKVHRLENLWKIYGKSADDLSWSEKDGRNTLTANNGTIANHWWICQLTMFAETWKIELTFRVFQVFLKHFGFALCRFLSRAGFPPGAAKRALSLQLGLMCGKWWNDLEPSCSMIWQQEPFPSGIWMRICSSSSLLGRSKIRHSRKNLRTDAVALEVEIFTWPHCSVARLD